jgi:hypothetical protein
LNVAPLLFCCALFFDPETTQSWSMQQMEHHWEELWRP